MTKLNYALSLFLMLIIYLSAGTSGINAQSTTITGVVTDAQQEALIGVNILVEGQDNLGAVTEIDGSYSITIPSPNETLIFSYIGYEEQRISTAGKSEVSIILVEDLNTLDEVVVVGYGEVRKRDLTGSVASIKAEELDKIKPVSFEQGIQGKAAGVLVTSSQGGPGESVKIRVRGGTSINASNDPLYVIDGFALEGSALNTGLGVGNSSTSPLSTIDPSSIESIEVLKDASATAIYGSRGANGVILITTKKGREGKTEIDFETFQGVGTIARKLDLLSPQEFVDFWNEYAPWNPNDPNGQFVRAYRDEVGNNVDLNDPEIIVTDWQNEVLRSAKSSNYRLSLRGGTKNSKFSGSAGYTKQDGIVETSAFERLTLNMNVDQKIGERVNAGISLNIGNNRRAGVVSAASENANGRNGVITSAILFSPVQGLTRYNDAEYDENGRLVTLRSGDITNPFLLINGNTNDTREIQAFGNAFASYRITDDIKFKSSVRGNLYSSKGKSYFSERFGWGRTANGRAFSRSNLSEGITFEQQLSYNKNIGNDNFNAVLVYEQQQGSFETILSSSTGFNLPGVNLDNLFTAEETQATRSNQTSSSLKSFLGRANYNLDDKYLFTVSARYDGSSRFAEGAKWGFFPSAAVAWKIGNEDFLKESSVIDDWKIKASYGVTGNAQIGSFRSLAQAEYSSYILGGSNIAAGIATSSLSNPDLTWETTTQYDVGTTLSLFDYRLNVSLDIYNKDTRDLLLEVPLPSNSGYTFSFSNIGKVNNRGVELSIGGTVINKKDFSWSSNFNISFNKNEVQDLGDANEFFVRAFGDNQTTNDYVVRVGESLGSVFGLEQNGLYQYSDFEEFNGLSEADAAAKLNADAEEQGLAFYDVIYTLKEGTVLTAGVTEYRPGLPKFEDVNGDGIVNSDDRQIIGNTLPEHFGGLTNNFKFKGVDLSVLTTWSYGNDIYNKNLKKGTSTAIPFYNKFGQVRDRWTPTNTDTDVPSTWGYGDSGTGNNALSEYLEDGSYIRIANVTLGYTFPKSLISKAGFRTARFYVAADNLHVFTNYSGYDPEVSVGNNQLTPGLDIDSYPRQRTFRVGLSFGL